MVLLPCFSGPAGDARLAPHWRGLEIAEYQPSMPDQPAPTAGWTISLQPPQIHADPISPCAAARAAQPLKIDAIFPERASGENPTAKPEISNAAKQAFMIPALHCCD